MRKKRWIWILYIGLISVLLSGCNLLAVPATDTLTPDIRPFLTQTAVEIALQTLSAPTNTSQSLEVPTETAIESEAPADTQETIETPISTLEAATLTPTEGPLCTLLLSLNFRSGPGLAYRPPIRALPEGAEVIPQGFNPQGVPGGPWVQAMEPVENQVGWLSAGEQFISCNIDLTTLPSVAVAPPSPPPPPEVVNSLPDGEFPDSFVFEEVFDPNILLRMIVFDSDFGDSDGDGIKMVEFSVTDQDGNLVYQSTEQNAGFCIFGGGEPDCNPWVIEDTFHKWEPGGDRADSGTYELRVTITNEADEVGSWSYELVIDFP